jgi:hypothetical protein
MPIWTKKEQYLHEVGIPDLLKGCMLHTKNWIWGHSCINDNRQLAISSSEVTSVIEKAKTLTAKGKTDEFKSHRERDQLNTALENKELHGRTRATYLIASWKEVFVDESHLYKKCKTHEPTHNDEETFAHQFFNLMR